MELQKLQRVVVDALEDIKAQDIKVFNTVGQSDMFDRVVVATGNSNRQTRALAWHVVQKVKEAGGAVTSVEGTDPGEWVLVDLGDIVVHLMQPSVRQYYALEEMWGAKPVRLKLAAERRPSLAPSSDAAEPDEAESSAAAAAPAPRRRAASVDAAAATPPRKAAVSRGVAPSATPAKVAKATKGRRGATTAKSGKPANAAKASTTAKSGPKRTPPAKGTKAAKAPKAAKATSTARAKSAKAPTAKRAAKTATRRTAKSTRATARR